MSIMPASEPVSSTSANSGIAAIVDARPRDVGGFKVRRLLPSRARRLIGPFIFLDHMGPTKLVPGQGIDVLQPGWSCSVALPWTAHARSGGILFQALRSGSSKQSATGRSAVSPRFPEMKSSLRLCHTTARNRRSLGGENVCSAG